MRKIFLLLSYSILFHIGCNKEEDIEPAKGTEFVAGVNLLKHGVDIKGEEMQGGGLATDDIIAIRIKEKGATEYIASGLFRGDFVTANSLNVSLRHGVTYEIEAVMRMRLSSFINEFKQVTRDPFNMQFILTNVNAWTGDRKSKFVSLTDMGAKDSHGMCKGEVWYYKGEIVGDKTAADNLINVDLRRVSFAVKYELLNLSSNIKFYADLYVDGKTASGYLKKNNDILYYILPDIETVYNNLVNNGVAESTESYKIYCGYYYNHTNLAKEYIDFGKSKANTMYTLKIDCNPEIPVSVSIKDLSWGYGGNV